MRLRTIKEAVWEKRIGGYNPDMGEKEPIELNDPSGLWYHGTNDINASKIKQSGLSTGAHVTRNIKLARFSARRAVERFGGKPTILKVTIDQNCDAVLRGTKLDSKIISGIITDIV